MTLYGKIGNLQKTTRGFVLVVLLHLAMGKPALRPHAIYGCISKSWL